MASPAIHAATLLGIDPRPRAPHPVIRQFGTPQVAFKLLMVVQRPNQCCSISICGKCCRTDSAFARRLAG